MLLELDDAVGANLRNEVPAHGGQELEVKVLPETPLAPGTGSFQGTVTASVFSGILRHCTLKTPRQFMDYETRERKRLLGHLHRSRRALRAPCREVSNFRASRKWRTSCLNSASRRIDLGFTQVIERREIDLPVATWFQGGAEQWPMPRLQ